ncbi:MAG: response regulator [Agriterribacter sp.]
MNAYFKYLLLSVFIAALLLIVFLQFNSNRSINKLIDGNESMLNHIEVKANLQRLQTNIIMLESKVKGSVISGAAQEPDYLASEIRAVNEILPVLDSLTEDSSVIPLMHSLGNFVKDKIDFNNKIINAFHTKGKAEAELLINTQRGKQLTDSIRLICSRVEEMHQRTVTGLIEQADINGMKAKTLGTIMGAIAVLASIFIFVYVAYKVTQQQQLITRLNISEKNAKDAARTKENFLANMSHEIRTPLNAILGYTNILQRKDLDEVSKQQVQIIQRSGENLLAIVNDVLDLSKIEAGMMRIESAPFSMRGLIHSVETMLSPKAAEKQLQLITTVSNDVPDELEGDATRLTQVLINLIGNAIKFTEQGSISIEINNLGINGNIIQTGITVTDTGIGIAKEKLDLIFERFQQAEDAVTRKYGGTGLGLSIVSELVLLQKGTISAGSEPGKGTAFHISIPYKISSLQISPAANQLRDISLHTGFGKVKILVAEDNEINQSLIKHLFKEWQLNYDLVKNGREAIALLQRENYDLVLMDIQMPEMDGYTATQQIRETLKKDVPVIAMTAHAMAGEREKCLSYGMNEYISKPLREELLYKMIAMFTSGNEYKKEADSIIKQSAAQFHAYHTINLQYMREISMGNAEYEKAVTEQFMEIIPENLEALQQCWRSGNMAALKQTAHNMKTSVSIMGLTDTLQPYLDALEHEALSENSFQQYYTSLENVCTMALEEAGRLHRSL